MSKIFLEFERLKDLNSGLGQVCYYLGRQFSKILPPGMKVDCWLPKKHKGLFGPRFHYVSVSRSRLRNYFNLKKSYDIFHCMHQGSKYLPLSKKTSLILTIHDLNFIFEHANEKEERLAVLQKKINRASVVVTTSEFTKQEVARHFNIDAKLIKVIYWGCTIPEDVLPVEPAFALPGKFIFTLGVVVPKKNFHVLIDFLKQIPDLTLVIAGLYQSDAGYYQQIIKRIKELNLEDRVIIPGLITEAEKIWLYEHCEAFLLPSLLEGFGLPVIEAMNFGKPVFISNKTSLPEVGGEEAYYWNSFDPDDMATRFITGLKDYKMNSRKAEQIKQWAGQFTWDKTARQYLDVYQEVMT